MPASQSRRLLIATGVVAFYMALGWGLRLDPNSYLLLGIPLLIIFQLVIARRPVTELWVRGSDRPFYTWRALFVAIPFMVWPVWTLVTDWKGAPLPIRLWEIVAVLGTLPLGATLLCATTRTWRLLLACLLIVGGLYIGLLALMASLSHGSHPHHHPWQIGAGSFLLYLPVCFMMEEVFFRGGLDSYIQREGDRIGWLTAIYLSCLWGWWHMPIFPVKGAIEMIGLVIGCPLVTLIPGIPFSFFWRRSGSLLVTATVHAFIDGVRNAVM